MSLPIIGITTRKAPVKPSNLPSVMAQQSYVNSILKAGGLPVLIPSGIKENGWDELVNRFDGILFTGGGDIALEYFHGEPHPAVYGIDPERDALELGICHKVIEKGKPFLGICRGLQVVNVALGGTLFTHIPDQLGNALVHDFPGEDSLEARTTLLHEVNLKAGSRLSNIMGVTNLKVNSLHHQGIKDVAPGLRAVGYSPDGLVEAVELSGHLFGIAVQWHPEWLTNFTPIQKLFESFINAAGGK